VGIEVIGNQAFGHCTKLNSVKIPSTLKRIDGYAFGDCPSLRTFDFNEKIEFIGRESFNGAGFTELDLQRLVPNIVLEKGVFAGCKDLKTVKIYKGIGEIPESFGAMFNGTETEMLY